MAIEIKVPAVGESVTEVEIGSWLKNEGAALKQDEAVVTIESDKATVEVNAPAAGVLVKMLKHPGESAAVGEVIGYIETAAKSTETKPELAPAAAPDVKTDEQPRQKTRVMPSAQRVLAEHGLSVEEVAPTGPGGRLLKEDVLRHIEQRGDHSPASADTPRPEPTEKGIAKTAAEVPHPPETLPAPEAPPPPPPPFTAARPAAKVISGFSQKEEVVRMSPMRRTIAARLVEAKQNAALLTTFNEIDMSAVMEIRKQHQEAFQKRYNIKLGIMSFFVKAAVDALKLVPQVNAEVRGEEIVYKNHYDIGVAVGGGKGLVVPVIRDADQMSFSQIERAIDDYGKRAKDGKIELSELQGGTFTISNGGVFGSLLSTPIVNPPQSGILGLHAIQDRPIAHNGEVVIRPMMYVALTYDHRIVDGREGVVFLKRIKECLEDPARMLIET
jgi:2-oxoglutarate dehydrogenase E2 component (dihydrolipoamide succinyltransferase)